MAQLKLMKKEWMNWFKGTTLENITAWTEYYYINPDSQHWISNYQIWDEEWEVGGINTSGTLNNNSQIRSKNFIPVVPNQTYYGIVGSGYSFVVHYYRKDQSPVNLGFVTINGSGTFTIPSDVYYIKFNVSTDYGTTYNHDICINVSNPTFNGHYEPRIIKIEDILEVVDLSQLNWQKVTAYTHVMYQAECNNINRNYGRHAYTNLLEVWNMNTYGQTFGDNAPDNSIGGRRELQWLYLRADSCNDVDEVVEFLKGKYLIITKRDSPYI